MAGIEGRYQQEQATEARNVRRKGQEEAMKIGHCSN
jgi:hypothetical protein